MAAIFALIAAFCFALAAALQQKGQFRLAEEGRRVTGVKSLFRMITVPVWLLGSVVLLVGYGTQGIALGEGRLVVVQPLLVMTIVFALPFGYWITKQFVVRRQVLFTPVGNPDSGVNSAAYLKYLFAIVLVGVPSVLLIIYGTRAKPANKAAIFGVAAGLLFGLSASFAKATIDQLPNGLEDVLSHPEGYMLVGFGLAAFGIQQLSLSTGQFAPAMAAVAVSNPAISVLLGVLLFQERLTRPAWHVLVAALALVAAFYGAYMITAANREREMPDEASADPSDSL
ncbi:MAG: DMT family transporter [Solirubrobacterales bacterium]|nr:DMT family transporter [Solirubrobacterales bacterium]